MSFHIDFGPTKNCKNPDSYGEICVKCNQCGRFTADNWGGEFPQKKREPEKAENWDEEGEHDD